MPDDVAFATKPELAQSMLARALDAGVSARWVAADEVYGADPDCAPIWKRARWGMCWPSAATGGVPTAAGPMRADALAAGLPKGAWQRLSAGPGAKGQRYYDWAWVTLTPRPDNIGLIRRHPRHRELACYRCYSLVPLGELVRVAGADGPLRRVFRPSKASLGVASSELVYGVLADERRGSPKPAAA